MEGAGLTTDKSGGRRRRSAQTPQRVEDAAQAMRNGASQGQYRGYVPSQVPYGQGNQPYGVVAGGDGWAPAGVPYPQSGQPGINGQMAMNGQPGINSQAAMNGQMAMNGQPYPGWNGEGMIPGSQQAPNPAGERFQTGSNARIGVHRGYVAVQTPPAAPKKKHNGLKAFLVVLLILIFGAGGTFAYMSYQKTKELNEAVQPYDALFCPGVYVDGILLEGMTPEQALNSVQSQIRQRNDAWHVKLTWQGQELATINAAMMNLSVDISEVMNDAWQQGHEGTYEERLQAMEELRQNPYHGYTATPSGDTAVIDNLLAEIKQTIDTPAVDATLQAFDPSLSYPFVLTDEVYGRRLDTQPVIEKLYHMVSEMETGSVELEPETVAPNILKEDLQRHYMLRSSVYTPISTSSSEDRNKNITRALELVNGYVLKPGATFSFNGVVGERTIANGFFPAEEYVYNEHVLGVGGGACQASTTVYQAAVNAGMKIVHREPHSDSVSYTEYGMDATVYWVGKRKIDLVFKNTTEGNIYFTAGVQQDPSNRRRLIAKVTIYGEYMGDLRYQLASEIVKEIEAPEKPEYVKDTEGTYVTYKDQQKSVSKARVGYIVKSYRLEYQGNTLVGKTDLYTDEYKPHAEKIYVGVKDRE